MGIRLICRCIKEFFVYTTWKKNMRLSEGRNIVRRKVGGEREESERKNIVKLYVILEENAFMKLTNKQWLCTNKLSVEEIYIYGHMCMAAHLPEFLWKPQIDTGITNVKRYMQVLILRSTISEAVDRSSSPACSCLKSLCLSSSRNSSSFLVPPIFPPWLLDN